MPHWKLKATIQRALSWLPAANFWNSLFQRYVTRSVALTEDRFERKLFESHTHLQAFRRFSPDPQAPFTVLDLGTGWHPVVPLGLYLCGGQPIWTYDIAALTTVSLVRAILEQFLRYAEQGKLQKFLPDVLPERLASLRPVLENRRLRTPRDLLAPLGIHIEVKDAQQTGLAEQSIDLLVSVGVWGHIPEPVLAKILSEFHRLASARAVMSHWINMSDLYHYFDRGITPFNFLQFTDEQWRSYDNTFIPQNRLRISDYRRILKNAKWDLVQEEVDSGKPEDLQKVPLAPRFQNYSTADQLVTSSWLTARPK